ncbi:hypothetical protein CKAH01_08129 [Colletotrichum kahawae]|uniref:Uncharacterized protein n=1 Tax=Colletotrichum kahawae TaxID=34407 RepID=A0AAD9Y1T7_COLKA|nr:hypothetical protein CKAH01_08129 [Colletotrichum kahawae]
MAWLEGDTSNSLRPIPKPFPKPAVQPQVPAEVLCSRILSALLPRPRTLVFLCHEVIRIQRSGACWDQAMTRVIHCPPVQGMAMLGTTTQDWQQRRPKISGQTRARGGSSNNAGDHRQRPAKS